MNEKLQQATSGLLQQSDVNVNKEIANILDNDPFDMINSSQDRYTLISIYSRMNRIL